MNFHEALWKWLLQAEWQGTFLILLILSLSLALGRFLSARWRFALWMVVVARLLLPSIELIPARANRLVPPTPKQAWKQIAPEAPVPAFMTQSEPLVLSPASEAKRTVSPLPGTQPDQIRRKLPSLGEMALWIWGTVALGGILRLGVSHWFFLRRLGHRARPPEASLVGLLEDCKNAIGIRRKVALVITDVVDTPAMLGLFSPRLLLPEDVVESQSPEALRLIFLHELAHLKRQDAWTNLLGFVAAMVHWFNPLVWWALRRMRAEREMAVDAMVLSVQAGEAREAYGETLLSLLVPNRSSQVQSLLGIVEDKTELKKRMRAIARYRPGAYAWSILGVALVLGAVLIGFAQRLDAKLESLPHELVGGKDGIEMFLSAARQGDIDRLRQFAEAGFDLNTPLNGETGLFNATFYQRAEAVRFLISKGARVDAKTDYGETAVARALLYGNREIADLLIAAGAHYDKTLYLVGTGDLAGLKELDAKAPLQKGALRNALRYAADAGHAEVFDWLLAKAAFANDQERAKKLQEIYLDVVKWGPASMLAHLETLGVESLKFGAQALSTAISGDEYQSRKEVMKHLLEKGIGEKSAQEGLLGTAVRVASFEIVRMLVEHGANVNPAGPGTTPLAEAAVLNRRDVAKLLLDHGADPNGEISSKGAEGQNTAWCAVLVCCDGGLPHDGQFHRWRNAAWSAACNTDTPDLVELLIRRGADVKSPDKQGRSIFYALGRTTVPQNRALVARERETVRMLLRAGADPKLIGQDGVPPLLWAIERGHIVAAEELLKSGVAVSGSDHFGNTALGACMGVWNHELAFSFMERLLKKGADPNAKVTRPWLPAPKNTPVSLLVRTFECGGPQAQKVAKLLLDHGAKFADPVDEKTQRLLAAAGRGDLAAIKKAVSEGADVNGADGDGWTALMVSTALGHEACAHWLESQKAPCLTPTKDGYSLLSVAAEDQDLEKVSRLLEQGADPNSPNLVRSLLHSAIVDENRPLFDLLLKHGAKGTGEDIKYCIRLNQPAMARLLLDSGGAIEEDPPNWEKRSNLYYAVYYRQYEILQMLLDHGADPLAKDKYGMTPLDATKFYDKKSQAIIEAELKRRQAAGTTSQGG